MYRITTNPLIFTVCPISNFPEWFFSSSFRKMSQLSHLSILGRVVIHTRSGIRKAAVLPLPVSATPMISRFCKPIGMAWRWIGVGSWPKQERVVKIYLTFLEEIIQVQRHHPQNPGNVMFDCGYHHHHYHPASELSALDSMSICDGKAKLFETDSK